MFGDGHEGWKRVQVGIAGLAGTLLIIGLGSAVREQLGLSVSPANPGNATISKKDSDEPMADLGVAPGAAQVDAPTQGAPPQTATQLQQ
jgi:hypothetical protein